MNCPGNYDESHPGRSLQLVSAAKTDTTVKGEYEVEIDYYVLTLECTLCGGLVVTNPLPISRGSWVIQQ